MKRIIAELFAESFKIGISSLNVSSLQMNRPAIAAHTTATAALSVAVSIPEQIPPRMMIGVINAGIASKNTLNISAGVRFTSCFGHFSFLAKKRTSVISTTMMVTPTNIPCLNILPTEAPVKVQQITMIMDGGMIGPIPPDTTNRPAVRSPGYPILTISL